MFCWEWPYHNMESYINRSVIMLTIDIHCHVNIQSYWNITNTIPFVMVPFCHEIKTHFVSLWMNETQLLIHVQVHSLPSWHDYINLYSFSVVKGKQGRLSTQSGSHEILSEKMYTCTSTPHSLWWSTHHAHLVSLLAGLWSTSVANLDSLHHRINGCGAENMKGLQVP